MNPPCAEERSYRISDGSTATIDISRIAAMSATATRVGERVPCRVPMPSVCVTKCN
jgi:hypothetical protein